ncbi:aminotransferase class V-fold PLP-dependent enzyme [Microbacterium sp. RD1]|uniref:aminotransferase class V-fold PLP-dependent enzyme n=1 Tax=Microbacterium sp. RD1 TaxID=3457313 RepID=UPI003FA53530
MRPDSGTTLQPPRAMSGHPARALWDLSSDTVHLNHGSYGAVPTVVTEQQVALIRLMNTLPGRWFGELPGRVAQARQAIAGFLGSDPDRTALVPNASAGVSVVLSSLDLTRGADIVVTDHAYGAVRMAAERVARRLEGTVTVAPVALEASDDEVVDALVHAVSARTGLVIIDEISSATARVFPVADIAHRMRAAGVPVLVDAAHSPAMIERPAFDDVDYWVGNLHKWGCAPRGTAAVIASGPVAASLHPLIDSWGAPHPFPARFDTQGTIDVTSYLAAPSALALIDEEFGWREVREYSSALVGDAQRSVAAALEAETGEHSFPDVGAPAAMMRLVELPAGLVAGPDDAHVVSAALARLGFQTAITSWRDRGFLRLSAHVYNAPDDYASFVERGVPAVAALHAARVRRDVPLAEAVAQTLADAPSP